MIKTDRIQQQDTPEEFWTWEEKNLQDDWLGVGDKISILTLNDRFSATSSSTARPPLVCSRANGLLRVQAHSNANDGRGVDMYSLHQSCLYRLTSRHTPTLQDAVAWSNRRWCPPDGPGSKIEPEVEAHRENEDFEEGQTLENGDDSYYRISYDTEIPYADDANVSLWDLRKDLEKNTVVCRNEERLPKAPVIEDCRLKIQGQSNQKLEIAENDAHVTESRKESNSSALAKIDDPESRAKQPAKKERNIKTIRKYCKWYFKSCQDGVIEDEPSFPPAEKINIKFHESNSLPKKQTENCEIAARNSSTSRLSIPGEEYLADVERNATGESSSCSISPDSISSDSAQRHADRIVPFDAIAASNETSETTSSRSAKSDSIQNLTRIFRRSSPKHRISSPSYCGYSLERDYCVDLTTDRIFKEFLKPNPLFNGELPSFSKRNPILRKETTQLRRQLMRKQYSDSAAVYYGQRMRRWRVKKQRSDSVNCPVDRAVLRRQDKINEEFYPEELKKEVDGSRGEFGRR